MLYRRGAVWWFREVRRNNHPRVAGVTSFGMGSSVPNGDLRFTHSGGLDSYSSFSIIFPADRSSVVVLCNFPSPGLPNFVMGIRSIMLGS
jgi:hypothetical protein